MVGILSYGRDSKLWLLKAAKKLNFKYFLQIFMYNDLQQDHYASDNLWLCFCFQIIVSTVNWGSDNAGFRSPIIECLIDSFVATSDM